MSIKLNPYVNFAGNAREAMEFYKQVLGGELTLSTFSDFPGMEIPEGFADKIMHGQLLSDDLTLMGSDAMSDTEGKSTDAAMSLSGDDAERLTKMFNDLSDGGKITQPLEPQVWGDTFGMLEDKFGVTWMVNIAKA